jgi:hypothetical protein
MGLRVACQLRGMAGPGFGVACPKDPHDKPSRAVAGQSRAVDNMNEAHMSLRMVLAEPTSCLTLSTGNANMRFSILEYARLDGVVVHERSSY